MPRSKNTVLYILLGALALTVVALLGYILVSASKTPARHEPDQGVDRIDKVCMTHSEYARLSQPPSLPSTSERDYRVIRDPLFPPLNRTDTVNHVSLEANIKNRNMYVPTNETGDTFRMVGYLASKDASQDAGGNNWKLFARDKDRHTSEFYIVPSNNNYDIKIFLTPEVVKGERLRDLYTIPSRLTFDSPMLNKTPYEFVEIPKADLAASTRYM